MRWRWSALVLMLAGGCMPPVANNPNSNGSSPPQEPRYPAMRPTVTGAQLNLAQGETATDRALMLTQKLAAVEEERKNLAARVEQLKTAVEEKDKALLQASRDVLTACEEVSHTRTDLQGWKQEMVVLRDKLHGTEKENMTNLQSIISLLEKFMNKDKPQEGGRMPESETKEIENEAPPPKKETKGQ
jgi:hypothetical protein